jgi:RNA polymerase sigma-70 factor (ECF subfamily)
VIEDQGDGATPLDVRDLVRHGVPEVFRYAVRLTGGDSAAAEDLVQEVCLDVVRAVRSNPGVSLSVGWMIVVARRRWADHVRRATHESSRLERIVSQQAQWEEPDWDHFDAGEILRCLGAVADDQRAALVFRYVDDLSVREVAELMGRSVSATESLLARGRRDLARLVKEA